MNEFSFFQGKNDRILGQLYASLPQNTFVIGFWLKKPLEVQNVLPWFLFRTEEEPFI